MTPPEAENFELFRPIYSQECSLAIANRISDPKIFLAPTGARGCPPTNPKRPLDPYLNKNSVFGPYLKIFAGGYPPPTQQLNLRLLI